MAMDLFAGLETRMRPEDLAWDHALPLAPERLRLARLLLDRGEPERAIAVAEVLEHPQPVAFLPALASSLEVRIEALEALGRHTQAAELRERLQVIRGATSASG